MQHGRNLKTLHYMHSKNIKELKWKCHSKPSNTIENSKTVKQWKISAKRRKQARKFEKHQNINSISQTKIRYIYKKEP